MKKLLGAAVTGLLLWLAAACGNPQVSGSVLEKEYEPAYSYTMMVPQYMTSCSTVNGTTSCTQQLMYFLPVEQYVADEWSLKVLDDTSHESHWVRVDEDTYDATSVGDHYSNMEDE